ncbi:hypothetical protein [Okeania sp. SIO2B3]|uniref:hypothetical protein n=1 Tax=Okeania sp. SIO2B3 TaxID=2607784 RepID=UPI0025F946D4|nr:hypothetical protein [Okeania sp. SIO2B3]
MIFQVNQLSLDKTIKLVISPKVILDNLLKDWLLEDIGRGDRTTSGLFVGDEVILEIGHWLVKEIGVITGLAIAARVF